MVYEFLTAVGPESKQCKSEKEFNMVELHTPIEFFCTVDGETLTASLTHAEDDLTKWLYHISFSNGYKGVFTISREHKCIVERDQHVPSSYAVAIAEDVSMLYQFNPTGPLPFAPPVLVKNETVRVWAKMAQDGLWVVYFHGNCRFFLHPSTGQWQAETFDHPESYIVPEVERAVVKELTKRIRLTPVGHSFN